MGFGADGGGKGQFSLTTRPGSAKARSSREGGTSEQPRAVPRGWRLYLGDGRQTGAAPGRPFHSKELLHFILEATQTTHTFMQILTVSCKLLGIAKRSLPKYQGVERTDWEGEKERNQEAADPAGAAKRNPTRGKI